MGQAMGKGWVTIFGHTAGGMATLGTPAGLYEERLLYIEMYEPTRSRL